MTRRIALITQDWLPNGGVANYVRDLATALRAAGHETLVMHADTRAPAGADCDEHCVEGLTASRSSDPTPIDRALDRLTAFAPAIVHVHANDNFALEVQLRRRFAVVKTLHNFDFCPTGTKYHYLLERACDHPTSVACLARMVYKRCTPDKRPHVLWGFYRRATAANRNNAGYSTLIVASDWVRRQAMASGYPGEQIRILPYFTTAATHVEPVGPEIRQILFCGRVFREKGLDLLLRALARLEGPWRLVVAGDGSARPEAERLAARLDLADRVTFLGWTDRATLSTLYRRSAVIAVPSRWPEPFGIVGLEALAHARPVVAFAVGGIPEWLDDGVNGWLVPPYDLDAFAHRLRACLDSPGLAARMGALGRERVERDFSIRSHLVRLLGIYEAVRGPASDPTATRTR